MSSVAPNTDGRQALFFFQVSFRLGGRASHRLSILSMVSGRAKPSSLRFCLSHFRRRNTTSQSIGPRPALKSSCATARFVPRTPPSVMAAAANRRMMNSMIGSEFAAASVTGATRRSLSCRPFLLPTAITVSSPGARRCNATSWKAVPWRPRHLPSKTPIVWPIPPRYAAGSTAWILLSRPFPICARRCGPSRRGSAGQRSWCRIRCPCVGIPFSHSLPDSGLCGFRKTRPAHHPCLGKPLLSA